MLHKLKSRRAALVLFLLGAIAALSLSTLAAIKEPEAVFQAQNQTQNQAQNQAQNRAQNMAQGQTSNQAAADEFMLFVAPNGSDSNSGSLSQPLATLTGARNLIRQRSKQKKVPVVVNLRGGNYILQESFELQAQDSGTAEAPVTYQAYQNEKPRLIGGKLLQGFIPVTDPNILDRLPTQSKGNVLQTSLPAQGITDFGQLDLPKQERTDFKSPLEIFFDRQPMPLARYPNQGWMRITSVPNGPKTKTFEYAGDRPQSWSRSIESGEVWLYGNWFHSWASQYLPLASVNLGSQQMTLKEPHGYGLKANGRFVALNLIEELDRPGEWYLDKKSGLLYFYPPGELKGAEVIASSTSQPLVMSQGASHIVLAGLSFEATRGNGIEINAGEAITLRDCEVYNVGALGVKVEGGQQHTVESCHVHDTGNGGLALIGGDRQTLTPAKHQAINNDIHHFNRWNREYRPGIYLEGVGQYVAHNHIHNTPHVAIQYKGNDHIVELNEIDRVVLDTDDAGAIYHGRDVTMRGNVFQHNYIHHSGPEFFAEDLIGNLDSKLNGKSKADRTEAALLYGPPKQKYGTAAIYFDDWDSGNVVEGNVFERVNKGILINGGRDHQLVNNVFLAVQQGIKLASRQHIEQKKQRFAPGGLFYEQLQAANFTRPPYSTRYPGLATTLEQSPELPLNNIISRNVFSASTDKPLDLQGGSAAAKVTDNAENVRLPADNSASALAKIEGGLSKSIQFEPIPFNRIGLTSP
ncbi:MAG: right-handed parallel beta-helix repeat-containing protein [Phormidesmis sp.]